MIRKSNKSILVIYICKSSFFYYPDDSFTAFVAIFIDNSVFVIELK